MSRPLLRETIGYRPMGMQDFSPRRRSFWVLRTSMMAGNPLNEPPVAPRPRGIHPAVREIHKNAWLKRQPSPDKKGTPFSKKGEKFWVVFCVHDDVEAFLEFYSEPKMGAIHKPLSAVSLKSCLHVSPSIVGQDNEYQFAVTLQTEVIRLVAANWDQMIEWVESLQGKLREMNILSPKDNLYSKLPETKLGTGASTRDPNSPLPPTPSSLAAAAIVAASSAGQRQLNQNVQLQRSTDTSNSSQTTSSRGEETTLNNPSSSLSTNGNTSNNIPVIGLEREDSRNNQPPLLNSHYDTVFVTPHQSSSSSSGESSQESLVPARRKPKVSVRVSVDVNNGHRGGSGNIVQNQQQQQRRHQLNASTSVTSSANTTVVVIGDNDFRIHNGCPDSRSNASSTSVTIRCSSSPNNSVELNSQIAHQQQQQQTNNQNNEENGQNENGLLDTSEENDSPNTVFLLHGNGRQAQNVKSKSRNHRTRTSASNENVMEQGRENELASTRPKKSTSSENIYERIYLPERETTNMDSGRNGAKHVNNSNCKMRSQVDRRSNGAHRSSAEMSPEEDHSSDAFLELHARRMISNGGSSQRSASVGRIEHPSSSARLDHKQDCPRRNENRNGHVTPAVRSIGNSTFFYENDCPMHPSQLQGHPIDALIGSRVGDYRLRRNDNSIGGGSQDVPDDNQTNEITSGLQSNHSSSTNGSLPLKEQQVIHLQMEINHPGGVRLTLRKKDCINSIAFVDYLGAVWVAGWKQTQYPVLYYAFHVGDQILKVAGVTVQSSMEAIRAIKMVSSMQVEFIIRRLPYGRVFALKRSRDGEPLGLVAEGGSGEISEVLPEGLAARYGLPPKGLSLDGQTPCNWYLTEVNNRPLSLMSKENEVKDRLNAVGKEISILVQPADLVKHLRKNLKSYKGFKDYVVG